MGLENLDLLLERYLDFVEELLSGRYLRICCMIVCVDEVQFFVLECQCTNAQVPLLVFFDQRFLQAIVKQYDHFVSQFLQVVVFSLDVESRPLDL